jgi:UDP-2-acetamido-2,6-beta-L-arabino-hexul-4-ose reductase
MRIGITGSNGFIGWHTRAFFKEFSDIEVVSLQRDDFYDPDALQDFVKSVSVIIHLAGINRGEDEDVLSINRGLANRLVSALDSTKATPHVIFSSSTHNIRQTAYGRSKRECTRIFTDWSERNKAKFTDVILPNVFGERGKPFYNSVVSTFCHQVAIDEKPTIIDDAMTHQIYVRDVVKEFKRIIDDSTVGPLIVNGVGTSGEFIRVGQILDKLKEFKRVYFEMQEIPFLRNKFDVHLFNTFRHHCTSRHPIKLHSDDRGSLYEAAKCSGGGQTFVSTTEPGITRGNHYHTRKIERFVVLRGSAEVKVREILSNATYVHQMTSDDFMLDIPTYSTHNVTNVGNEDLLMMFWCNEIFNPDDTDTFQEDV